jgi:hypothetical protein
LNKETKEENKRWKDHIYSWISKISIAKTAILPKEVFRFSAIPIKIPMSFIERK